MSCHGADKQVSLTIPVRVMVVWTYSNSSARDGACAWWSASTTALSTAGDFSRPSRR